MSLGCLFFHDSTCKFHDNNISVCKKYQKYEKVVVKSKNREWLIKAGLVIKIKVCNRAEIPLEAFCKPNIFKLFIFDIGLLGCLLDLPVEAILNDDYGIAKGYFAENFVAQELQTAGRRNLYSWTERNSEIEFLITDKDVIVPLEVKSGMRTQAKSMQQYIRRYSPSRAVILSKRNFTEKAGSCIQYLPLYMAGMIPV